VDPVLLFKALILGIVEGLTEFLPISSTGHLILVGDLLGFNDERGKIFEIVIQTGAMFAIVWEYRARFGRVLARIGTDAAAQRFVANVAIAFVPAAVLGLLFGSHIKAALFKPVPVAIAFIVGAFVILWAERREHRITVELRAIRRTLIDAARERGIDEPWVRALRNRIRLAQLKDGVRGAWPGLAGGTASVHRRVAQVLPNRR